MSMDDVAERTKRRSSLEDMYRNQTAAGRKQVTQPLARPRTRDFGACTS